MCKDTLTRVDDFISYRARSHSCRSLNNPRKGSWTLPAMDWRWTPLTGHSDEDVGAIIRRCALWRAGLPGRNSHGETGSLRNVTTITYHKKDWIVLQIM